MKFSKISLLSVVATLALTSAALAETKVVVGVGHMCCGKCVAAAKEALKDVASDVAIEGKNVTITLKEDGTTVRALGALRRGGFPAKTLDAGTDVVTVGVRHLCCGNCKTSLEGALKESKIEALDLESIKIGEDSVSFKAKAGTSLNLIKVMAAMENEGFSASKLTMTKAAASNHKSSKAARRIARK